MRSEGASAGEEMHAATVAFHAAEERRNASTACSGTPESHMDSSAGSADAWGVRVRCERACRAVERVDGGMLLWRSWVARLETAEATAAGGTDVGVCVKVWRSSVSESVAAISGMFTEGLDGRGCGWFWMNSRFGWIYIRLAGNASPCASRIPSNPLFVMNHLAHTSPPCTVMAATMPASHGPGAIMQTQHADTLFAARIKLVQNGLILQRGVSRGCIPALHDSPRAMPAGHRE